MIPKDAKIFICGHRGMVGSACVRKFEREGYFNLLKRTHAELDLRDQQAVAWRRVLHSSGSEFPESPN